MSDDIPDRDPTTCIHAAHGLCERCQDEYDEDPDAYLEYGDYLDGLERWRKLQAEIAAERELEPAERVQNADIPF
jgi:hypothetical protein